MTFTLQTESLFSFFSSFLFLFLLILFFLLNCCYYCMKAFSNLARCVSDILLFSLKFPHNDLNLLLSRSSDYLHFASLILAEIWSLLIFSLISFLWVFVCFLSRFNGFVEKEKKMKKYVEKVDNIEKHITIRSKQINNQQEASSKQRIWVRCVWMTA